VRSFRFDLHEREFSHFSSQAESLHSADHRIIGIEDETMASGMKRFRVFAEMGKLPLVKIEAKLPH
jgi:hypothetical protein